MNKGLWFVFYGWRVWKGLKFTGIYQLSMGTMCYLSRVCMSELKCLRMARQVWPMQSSQDTCPHKPVMTKRNRPELWFLTTEEQQYETMKHNCKVGAKVFDRRAQVQWSGHQLSSFREVAWWRWKFFNRIITGDETWIHHYGPEIKHQSML
jgi:hypothetical protein